MDSQTSDITLKPSVSYFGTVLSKGHERSFGILQEDRRKHMYVLGKTGMGKTTMLTNMVLQDIYHGHGVCFIDPHGDASEYILDRIPTHRQNEVIYFNPADTEFPIGLNILEAEHGEEPFLIASGLISVFNHIWSGMWSARMEYILNNTLLAILEKPGHTLLTVVQMLTDSAFRKKLVEDIQDPLVKNFWTKEFASFNDRYKQEAISPILNKIGQFLSIDVIRNILGQSKSTINFRDIMDSGKILIVNLAKGKLGEDNSDLLGSLIVSRLQLAAMSRVDIPEEDRKDFFLTIDEFQSFTSSSFANILSEARKYRLNLTLAHQYLGQLDNNEKVRSSVFGNVGSMVVFALGNEDARAVAGELAPDIEPSDLVNLHRGDIALTLVIEGKRSKAFIAKTLSPIFQKMNGKFSLITDLSRQRYGNKSSEVIGRIIDFLSGKTAQIVPISKSHTADSRSALNSLKKPKKAKTNLNPRLQSLKIARNSIGSQNSPANPDNFPDKMTNSNKPSDLEEGLFNLPN